MEYKCVMLVNLAVIVLALTQVAFANSCTKYKEARNPSHNDSEDKKVYYADYVVFGMAGRTKKGDTFPAVVEGVRTIEFEVTCVYKRIDPVPTKIYITNIGNKRNQIPNCPPAPLKAGEAAVMYLSKVKSTGNMVDNLFQIEFSPNSNPNITNDQKIDDLTILCDLTLEFPTGGDEDFICLPPLKPDECFSYTPTTTPKPATTQGMATKKPVVVVTAEPKTMPPKTEPTKDKPVDVKPVQGGDKDTYKTEDDGDKTGPSGDATVQVLSQSLVLLISALFVLV